MTNPLAIPRFYLRRQVFRFLGTGFELFGPDDTPIAHSTQKAFRLKEDIRVFAGPKGDSGQELLAVKARQVIDFSACYDIVDTVEGRKIGAMRRKGFSSIVRDSWEMLDDQDRVIGQLKEASAATALLRRVVNIIPQTFSLEIGGQRVATLKQRFTLFVYKMDAAIEVAGAVDERMLVAATILIAAIEGKGQ